MVTPTATGKSPAMTTTSSTLDSAAAAAAGSSATSTMTTPSPAMTTTCSTQHSSDKPARSARATSLTGSGVISNGGKTVSDFAPGDVITLGMFVDIIATGTAAGPGTDGFQSCFGAMLLSTTTGGVSGNLGYPNISSTNAGLVS